MLEKDPSVFKRILDRADSFGDVRVALFKSDGTLFYGDDKLRLPEDVLSQTKESAIERDNRLLFFKPLINEKRCHKCHAPEEKIRGFVVTSISTDSVTKEIGETEKRIFLFVLITAATLSLGLVLLLKRFVIDPLKSLEEGAKKIRDGNLDARVNLNRDDEFNTLAVTFNEMAERIEGEQKRLEKAVILKTRELEEQKDFSEAIFNNVVSGITVLDSNGNIVRINRAGAEILQIPFESTAGLKLTDIHSECKEMIIIRPEMSREIYITLRNGDLRPVGFANSPLLDKNGRERGIVVIFRDLTEVKKLQAEIRNKHRFEAMGKIISGVAHEIRNPIFAIQSIAQILGMEIESTRHQPLVQAMLKETKRIKNLVEELLLYSRPSRLNMGDVDIVDLIEELKIYLLAKNSGITFDYKIEPVRFRADRDKLTQVLLNLIDNAIGAGCGRINIGAEKKEGLLKIAVSDDGEGIDDECLDRIFEPFFTTKKDGTGLGLAISKKIIEDHGGNIEVRSKKNSGTTVLLSIPA